MSRDVLIYLNIFLITALVVVSVLFVTYINRPERDTIPDSLYVLEDSLYFDFDDDYWDDYVWDDDEEEERPSFINRTNVENNLTEQELLFMELTRRIQALYGVEEEEEIEEIEEEPEPVISMIDILKAELDSTRVAMQIQYDSLQVLIEILINDHNAEIDGYRNEINRFHRENQTLSRTIAVREQGNLDLRNQISSLNNIITGLRNEIHALRNPVIEPVVELDFKRLANVYNNMDAKKVAQLLQTMTPQQAVNVLKNMNQRKRSQVMTSLPNDVAAVYSELLMRN